LRKAIFFDRDGTLLVETGYLSHPSLVMPYHFTAQALKLAREAGFFLVVVSNQSGVARGYLREDDLAAVHERMNSLLAAEGAGVDAVYYCPHHPAGTVAGYSVRCDCRKPATGMGLKAVDRHGLDPDRSYVIGDKVTDFLFGRNLGAAPCLVRTGYGDTESKSLVQLGLEKAYIFDNVLEATKYIVDKDGQGLS
jgi:D-glycero-D-manno-heptose 1,7-bisphosphate phosphatase